MWGRGYSLQRQPNHIPCLQLVNDQVLSIVGVYLPYPTDVYSDYLNELEAAITALEDAGPVLVAGDLNAHLTGPNTNVQGDLVMDICWTGVTFMFHRCLASPLALPTPTYRETIVQLLTTFSWTTPTHTSVGSYP